MLYESLTMILIIVPATVATMHDSVKIHRRQDLTFKKYVIFSPLTMIMVKLSSGC